MQTLDRISAAEDRASRLNLSLWRVSKLAGVDYSNIHRWKRGECSPRMDLFEQVLGAIEGKLSDLEQAMAARLATPASPVPARPAA